MLKEAMDRLLDLARPELVSVQDRDYSTKPLHAVKAPQPPTLELNSLTALVDFIATGPDSLPLGFIVHVEDWQTVRLLGPLTGQFPQRDTYAVAKAMLPRLVLGNYLEATSFQIMLRTAFLGVEHRDLLIKLAGNVSEGEAITSVDDGMSQTVTVQSGITTKAREKLPNPAILAPFRTFLEVEQPRSEFIFRMEKGPSFGLWEADGGAWKLTAMQSCRAWLEEKLGPDAGVIVLA